MYQLMVAISHTDYPRSASHRQTLFDLRRFFDALRTTRQTLHRQFVRVDKLDSEQIHPVISDRRPGPI